MQILDEHLATKPCINRAFEHTDRAVQQLPLPGGHLIRVQAVLTRDLRRGALITGQPITTHPSRRAHASANEQIIEAALARADFPRSWLARARLPRSARAAVNHVLRTCNPMRPSELDRLVRSTHPYLTLGTGDPIDFERLAREYLDFLKDTGLSAPGQAPKLGVA